jgi:hypothetical protein
LEQLSVGSDLFATLVVVGLFVLFGGVLMHSYHIYAERKNSSQNLGLALDIAEELKNRVLAGHTPGLVDLGSNELEGYSGLLAQQGVGLHVEVRTLGGELRLAHGHQPDSLERYLSPPCSVSLPIAVAGTQGSAQLCELVVCVWRG